ncbi:MAG TPA: hypothetical protein VED41_04340 [Solirubrobacteraceae bacterium]|nr:hypothetical protein [Solirubrobacteraceae bacterium]
MRQIGSGQPSSFAGSFKLADWKNRGCTAALQARQGSHQRTIDLAGERVARLLYAQDVSIGERHLQVGDPACAGESLSALRGSAVLRTDDPNLGLSSADPVVAGPDFEHFRFAGQMVLSSSADVLGGVFARSVRVDGHVIATAAIPVAPYIAELRTHPGLQRLGDGHERRVKLEGFAYADGDLTLEDLTLDGGVLAVSGSVQIRGSLTGIGTVFASGPIRIDGRVSLRPDAQTSLVSASIITLR